MSILLRAATDEDAEAVMRLHMRCHEEAYGRHLPPEFFEMRRNTLDGRSQTFRKGIADGQLLLDALIGVRRPSFGSWQTTLAPRPFMPRTALLWTG